MFGVRPAGQHSDDQSFGVRADNTRLVLQSFRRPFAIAPMRARHVFGQGAVPRSGVTPDVRGDALAAVEDFDRADRGTGVHLFADQGVRHRVEETPHLDVVVDANPSELPFGILVVLLWQWLHGGTFDRLEQLAAADAKAAHLTAVHSLERRGDLGVAGGQREEGDVAQAAEDVGLGEADTSFDCRFVLRLARPRRQHADIVMRGHRGVGAVHLGVVEGRLVHRAFEVVRNKQAGCGAEEAEHADVRADPVR